MDPRIFSILHVFSVLLLTGSIFYIAANPQKHKKKKMMMITGVLSLLVLLAAGALMGILYKGLPAGGWTQGWVIVKLVVWLFLTGLAGMAYRKPKGFVLVGLVASIAIALFMVYLRPF